MITNLPAPVDRYFAAKKTGDIGTMLAQFAEDAVVHDERQTHRGAASIRAWMEETTRKYRVTAEVTEAATDGDRLRVAALVSGTFPGSPVTLNFRFKTSGDLITDLEIG